MLRASVNPGLRRFSSAIKCKRLEGKVAIVTASTDGIGFAIAKRLAQEGAKVMISSRKDVNVQRAVSELRSEGLEVSGTVCHVAKKEDRAGLFAKTEAEFGGLDILVSNAAINPGTDTVLNCPEDIWDKIMDVNVKSTYLLMRESLPLLKKSKSASMVLVSSISGYKPVNILGAYSVSKTALLGLTKAAADELVSDGIRVNCIAPGIIKTKFASILTTDKNTSEVALSMIPMGRFGQSEEMSGIVAFLVSDDASYITGETIVAAGGVHSRL